MVTDSPYTLMNQEYLMSDDIFIVTQPEDPIVAPIIDGLFAEYEQRYGDFW